MNTTFLIGNGFDICQNMATRYCQFYENHYTKLSREGISLALKEFRETISEYVQREKHGDVIPSMDDIDWSDLESALGKYAERLTEVQDYKDIILDINKELRVYIEGINEDFTITDKQAEKIYKDFCNPDVRSYLNYEEYLAMKQFKRKFTAAESINIINFNYTSTIEKILSTFTQNTNIKNIAGYNVSINQVQHIHGYLGNESSILVGVNDPSQIHNEEFSHDQSVMDLIVKPETNKMFGNGKIAQAKTLINQSQVFVLFGVSMGETDNMWWELIGKCLQSKDVRLIWFVYESSGLENPLLIGEKKRNLIKKFCKSANISDDNADIIAPKIYIGYNQDIFKIKTITD